MTCSSFCAAGLLTFGALWISGPAEAQVKSTIVIAPTEWETEPADWFGDAEQEAFEAQKERTYSDESTKHVIKDLVAEAVKVIDGKVREYGWRSTVKGIVNGRPVILGGKRDGLSPGMEFDLIERTEPLIDDETGEILDEGDEKAVGRLRVVEVKEKVSYCQKISGREAVKGDMVRLDEARKRGAAPARQKVLAASQ